MTAELRASGVFHCDTTIGAGVRLRLPPMPGAVMFHAVLSGECEVAAAGRTTRLGPGDVALLPHGGGHDLATASVTAGDSTGPGGDAASRPEQLVRLEHAPRRSFGGTVERLELGGPEVKVHAVCGALTLAHPAAPALPAAMPELLVVRPGTAAEHGQTRVLAEMILREAAEAAPGWSSVTERLVDVLALRAVRSALADHDGAGWWSAVRDERVASVVSAVRERPAEPWTLATLAAEAGLSRSAFAQLFGEVVGETPMAWTTRYRMALARTMLDEGIGVAMVARQVGYDSEVSFRRAYRRVTGTTPGAVRRAARGR